MRCAKATWQLQLYLDQQLPLEEIRVLEMHLSTCPACRAELHALEGVILALQETEQVIEPGNLTAHIMRRVALDVRKKEKKSARTSVCAPTTLTSGTHGWHSARHCLYAGTHSCTAHSAHYAANRKWA